MFSIITIVKLVLVLSFNFLKASANNITTTINDIDHSIDKIKNKYFLIRHDIFSPRNSVSTNFDTYSDSLTVISSKLLARRNEIFEKIYDASKLTQENNGIQYTSSALIKSSFESSLN